MDSPGLDIAEVVLIGTGGGYGESCIIHLGQNNWVVVDSCINPNSGKSLPLEYLEKNGIDVANNVKIIICTHWHDDHIAGISQLYEACTSATFCIADVLDLKKFLYSVSLDSEKYVGPISLSSTNEFNRCFDITKERNASIKRATKNLIIYNLPHSSHPSSVISLSPSEYSREKFDKQISTLISDYGPTNKVVATSPNITSIALFLKLGIHRVVLGADLEVGSDNKEGWLNVLDHHENILDVKASLIKISHHGSKTGYHERIWDEILEGNAVAKLTPWNRKDKLPTDDMIKTYLGHTKELFITSDITQHVKPKKRDHTHEKLIKTFNPTLKEIKFTQGVIRCRIPLYEKGSWDVQLFDAAKKL